MLSEGQASILQSGNNVFYNPVQASPSVQASMPAFALAAAHWLHPEAKSWLVSGAQQSCHSCSLLCCSCGTTCQQGLHFVQLGPGIHRRASANGRLVFRSTHR